MATVRVFNHHLHSSFYWLVAVDAVLFVLAFYAGAYLYFLPQPGGFENYLGQIPARASLFAAINVLCLAAMGLYEPRMREGASGILLRTIGGFVAAAMVMAAIFYVLPDLHMWRGIYFYAAATAFTANLISRSAVTNVTRREQFKNRVLVYGSGQAASTITNTMRRRADRQGFTVVGFVRVGGRNSPGGGRAHYQPAPVTGRLHTPDGNRPDCHSTG